MGTSPGHRRQTAVQRSGINAGLRPDPRDAPEQMLDEDVLVNLKKGA